MEGDGTGIEETHWFKSGAFDSVSSAKLAWRKAIDTGPSSFTPNPLKQKFISFDGF